MSKKSEITNQEILQAINGLDQKVGSLYQGFENLDQKLGSLDQKVDANQAEISILMNNFSTEIEKRFDKVDYRLDSLEHNQTDILSKLNNVAYKFEVRALEKRVEVLESK